MSETPAEPPAAQPSDLPHPDPAPAETKPTRRRPSTPALIGGVVVLVAAIGGGIAAYQAQKPTPFEAAVADCKNIAAPVRDDGHTVTFDRVQAKENAGPDDIIDVVCFLGKLNTPSRVLSHMDSTRALDGTQTDQWNGITARWNYHPDNGLNVTITDAN